MNKPNYEYGAEKNKKLLEERGIGFEDIITILEINGALEVIDHPNKAKYPKQKIQSKKSMLWMLVVMHT